MDIRNTSFILKERPFGKINNNTWESKDEIIDTLDEGTYLVEIHLISMDPAMRGWLDDRKSYLPPVGIGQVMRAGTIGQVIESRHDSAKKGDWVLGMHGVTKYAISNGSKDINLGTRLDVKPEKLLSVLGMTGFTAYFGLLDIGKPKSGETILVSAAAGAVGSIVGQIAKIMGLRTIGIAGGTHKCSYVKNELGFDDCVDYKSDDFGKRMMECTSNGIDIFFDNVGGDILDFALARLNKRARVVLCGAISQYNSTTKVQGPSNYLSLLINRATMQGFIVFDYEHRYSEAINQLGEWLKEGKLKSKEEMIIGIENFPQAFDALFSGQKMGKLILAVKE